MLSVRESEGEDTRGSRKHNKLLTADHVSHRRRLPVLPCREMPERFTRAGVQRHERSFAVAEQNQAAGRRNDATATVARERILPDLPPGVDIQRPDEILSARLIRSEASHPAVVHEGI